LRAIGEYKRMAFFTDNLDSVNLYRFKIAECYRKMGDFEKAEMLYDKILLEGISDKKLENCIILSSTICSINRGRLDYAHLVLDDLKKKSVVSDSVYFLSGITYLKERKWDKAQTQFQKITSYTLKDKANRMLEKTSNQKFKSPKLALLLSTFIPGSGQIYASKPVKGFIAFTLNVSLGYLIYKAVREDRNIDAALIGYFGLQRFYFGNMTQAEKYANEHNREVLDDIIVE
jgi:pentatricopeptide repeat protein